MLTPAQQKVKRELEELQINAALAHSKDQTIIPRKRISLKKWSFTIIVILLLIVTISLFLID
jgi:hypothetical protein